MLQDVTLRSSFKSFIGAGSVKVSVCPEYPVLTRVFCSTARPSSTSSCSVPWSVVWSCTWPRSCISGSALTAAWSPPVSPPTRTGPVSTIIFGNKKTFSYCCVQAAAEATAGPPPPRTRTPACRRLSTTGWRPATCKGEAVHSQAAACSDCGPGYGCVEEDGALCVVTTGRIRASPRCPFEGGCQKDQ